MTRVVVVVVAAWVTVALVTAPGWARWQLGGRYVAARWQISSATAYATFENLEGCVSPGRCRTACGTWLDDRAFTVAANPSLRLGCNQRIVVCGHGSCHRATVTDRTGSRFGFEFSYALAAATGMRGASWDTPRTIRWRLR